MKNMFSAIFALVAAALLLVPAAALAQASAEDRQIAGVTPDSFLYGFDTFFDGVGLFFTFDENLKAEKGLEIARERLFEAKVMIDDSKIDAARVAEREHENSMIVVKTSVERLELQEDPEEEIRDVLEIRRGLDEQEREIEDVKQNIRVRIEGQLTEEQKALVNSILNSISNQTERVKIDIRSREDAIKIKIRQETGKSEIEIEREIEDLKGAIGIEDIEVKAEIVGNTAQIKIENDFSTNTTERSALVNEIMTKFALGREKADRLLRIQVGDEDSERERLEIKVETRAGVTEVEAELRFNLGSADRNAILDAIVSRTKLTGEQVEAALEFEGEERIEEETKVRAEVFANVSEARVELKFDTAAAEKNAIAQEILNKAKMSKAQIESLLKIETVADNFEAQLSGANEVPAVATTASGRADLDLRRNDTELQFKVTVNNVENVTFSHIHLAPAGQNGPVAAFLFAGPAKTGAFTGILAEGVVTSANLTGPLAGQPFSALVDKIRAGEAYVNVHTAQNPAGEIRGQVAPEQAAQIRERLEAEAKAEKGVSEVKFEFRFPVTATEKAGIAEAIFQKLSALTANDILNVLELEVKDEGNNGRDGEVCIQVITPAVSPKGECRDFPTPCDVPEDWEQVAACPAGGKAVVITSEGFKPDKVEVSAGEAVTWINRDTTVRWPASGPHPQHTAYPETGGCIGSKFDACKGLAQGETFSFVFNQKGQWQYHDHLHFGAPFFGTVEVK